MSTSHDVLPAPPHPVPGAACRATLHRELAALLASLSEPDAAIVTPSNGGSTITAGCTAEHAHRLERAQLLSGRGPHLEALRTALTVQADVNEVRLLWPEFARCAREVHVHSFLTAPLVEGSAVRGTPSLHAHRSHALDTVDSRRLVPFANALVHALRVPQEVSPEPRTPVRS